MAWQVNSWPPAQFSFLCVCSATPRKAQQRPCTDTCSQGAIGDDNDDDDSNVPSTSGTKDAGVPRQQPPPRLQHRVHRPPAQSAAAEPHSPVSGLAKEDRHHAKHKRQKPQSQLERLAQQQAQDKAEREKARQAATKELKDKRARFDEAKVRGLLMSGHQSLVPASPCLTLQLYTLQDCSSSRVCPEINHILDVRLMVYHCSCCIESHRRQSGDAHICAHPHSCAPRCLCRNLGKHSNPSSSKRQARVSR